MTSTSPTAYAVPAPRSPISEPARPISVVPRASDRPNTGAKRLLLIEDDEDLRELFELELSELSYEVEAHGSAERALRSPNLAAIDIVLTDLNLPGMRGVELASRLQSLGTPVVAMTGSATLDDAIEAIRSGVQDYILKPTTTAAIDLRLQKVLRALRDQEELRRMRRRRRVRICPGLKIPGTAYLVEKWLGEGGMGVVYQALHTGTGRKVALKVLHSQLIRNDAAVANFRREAQSSARIGARGIVDILDLAELEDGRLIIAMEFLDGATLTEEIAGGDLAPARTYAILRQLCKGLGAAHGAGIVHRDVKPDNIMLIEDDRTDTVKVLDFGIAAFVADGETESSALTPGYAAPEQILGTTLDGRIDVYAVGCVAYEMLTGTVPFDGEEIADTLRMHMERAPTPPSELVGAARVPSGLEAVVLRCLSKDPDDRYTTMEELEAALCEAQVADGVLTAWDTLPLPAIDDARRIALEEAFDAMRPANVEAHRRAPWFAAAGLAFLAAGGVAWGLAPAESIALDAPAPVASERPHERVEALVHAAHEEGALARWVYPAPDFPERPTSIMRVKELEALGLTLGHKRAEELRREFGSALRGLGDDLWEREGGRPFARDYYLQSLVFEPDHASAVARAGVSPGLLASLQGKAERGEFTRAELIAAEPLAALAAPEVERADRVAQLRVDRFEELPATVDAQLSAFTEGRAAKPAAEELAGDLASEDAKSRAESAPEDDSDDEKVVESRRRPTEARSLARKAKEALSAGRRTEAEKLFFRALAADSRNLAALTGLGDLEFARANYGASMRYRKRAVNLVPRKGQLRIDLGDAYFKLLRYDDARKQYEKAAEYGSSAAEGRLAKVKAKLG